MALAPTPVDRWRARIAGQEVGVSRSIAFATTVIDLMKPMEMWAAGPFDYLHYYVSRDLLDRVAADNRIAGHSPCWVPYWHRGSAAKVGKGNAVRNDLQESAPTCGGTKP